jgi:hypothetical protein
MSETLPWRFLFSYKEMRRESTVPTSSLNDFPLIWGWRISPVMASQIAMPARRHDVILLITTTLTAGF